jgi:hypothetical protein
VDEHKRRVWRRLIESVDAFRRGGFDLPKLVANLHGLVHATELHDAQLLAQWRELAIEIDFEVHMVGEGWPPGKELDEALSEFRAWAQRALDGTDNQRT